MEKKLHHTKQLTRDYNSYFKNRIHILDVMLARRSWRKYRNETIEQNIFYDIEAFMKKSIALRNCPVDDIILFTNQDRLPELFKAAYKGFIGKINPWLSKVKNGGVLILSIEKRARDEERPLSYAFASLAAEDTVLYITEKGLGSVWMAGVNATEISKLLNLPSNKWVPACILFGKTNHRIGGFNVDNIVYKSLSRKRKPLNELVYSNFYGNVFDLNEEIPTNLQNNQFLNISDTLQSLSLWKDKKTNTKTTISQLEWELLIEAARIAPSSGNSQRWKFILIDDKSLIDAISKHIDEKEQLKGIIAGLGIPGTWLEVGIERPFWMIDLPISLSHISLMAAALGFGGKVYLNFPESTINSLLRIKSRWRTVGLVGLK
ncbi:MAG: nitroreductase family protein [Spirochaetota bacterium]|nr:nitroreductase family protein [Spirochaetota bacterium]